VPPALVVSSGELELAGVGHGRLDGVDQGRGAVVNGGHAQAEGLRIMTLRVPPAGDVVDGAEPHVETEPRADGVGDRPGDHFGDVPGHPGARVMRHRVGELVGEGRGYAGAEVGSRRGTRLREPPGMASLHVA
jgi:hypothetical protein